MNEKCVICDEPAELGRRGLCGLHYSRFVTARRALPEKERADFESRLIERKLLLAEKPKGRQVPHDVFAEVAAEVHGRPVKRKSFNEEAAEIAEQGAKEIERAVKKRRAKPRSSPTKERKAKD